MHSYSRSVCVWTDGVVYVLTVTVDWQDRAGSLEYIPRYTVPAETTLVTVYMGTNACVFSTDKERPIFLNCARLALTEKAETSRYGIVRAGCQLIGV